MTIANAVYREGIAFSPDGAMYVTPTGTASITGGTITGTNVLYVVAKWGIPFIVASTGTMGNNGAVSGMTALPATYSNGAWLYLPASAIAAGSAAGWYWFVASSTSAGTVYNSTYTSGVPTAGTTTAFATTGPGAFTGVTTQVDGPTISVPANALSSTAGHLRALGMLTMTNNANAKSTQWTLGGTDFTGGGSSLASNGTGTITLDVFGQGTANKQMGRLHIFLGNTTAISTTTYNASLDVTTALTFIYKFTRNGAATDNYVFEAGEIVVAN